MSDDRTVLKVENVKKAFEIDGEKISVLNGIDMDIKKGEFISIIGSSGCGKSTLLKMIMSLESVSEGSIYISGKKVNEPAKECSMIFQESRLFPWLNVEENIAFVLDDKKSKSEKAEIVKNYIDLVGLNGFERAVPNQLSGGMQQRVSIARALATEPELLLLDEPFGALDAFTRIKLQEETMRIWREKNTTMVLVTHDIDEAIFLSDRIFIFSEKPGVVKDIIEVKNARPRDRGDYEFLNIRRSVLLALFGDKADETIEFYI